MYNILKSISKWTAIDPISSMFTFAPDVKIRKEVSSQIFVDANKNSDFWNIVMSTILAQKLQTFFELIINNMFLGISQTHSDLEQNYLSYAFYSQSGQK